MYRTLALCALLSPCIGWAFPIVWQQSTHQTVAATCSTIVHRGYTDNTIGGCQYWRGQTCVVVVPSNIQSWAVRHYLSHEIKHCFVGNFHGLHENGDESDLHLYRPIADELIEQQ